MNFNELRQMTNDDEWPMTTLVMKELNDIQFSALFDIKVEAVAAAILSQDKGLQLEQVVVVPKGSAKRRSNHEIREIKKKPYEHDTVWLMEVNRKGFLDTLPENLFLRIEEDHPSPMAKAKAFTRTYSFLAQILPYTSAGWEKLSIFLNFLISKLPAPVEEDLSKGILETIDMDSYRVETQAAMKLQLPDTDAEIEPVPASGGGRKPEPELDRLSSIIKAFNDQFGNIPWTDEDRVRRLITEEIPSRVAADAAYGNAMRNSDRQNARVEHDKALLRVMTALLKDDTELFKQFSDNDSFRRWLTDSVFAATYRTSGGSRSGGSASRPPS